MSFQADKVRREQAAKRALAARTLRRREQADSALALMSQLSSQLEAFGVSHREEIQKSTRSDPQWRARFLDLFRSVGVDPLSSSKNMWSAALGNGLVHFYSDLAISASQMCVATRPLNGGLISLTELTERLRKARRRFPQAAGGAAAAAAAAASTAAVLSGGGGAAASATRAAGGAASAEEFTEEDVKLALGRLAVLGGGYTLVQLGGTPYVRSVAEALDMDGSTLLNDAVQRRCYATTVQQAAQSLAWSPTRVQQALNGLTADSMAWVDEHGGVTTYYFPSFLAF